MLLSGVDGSVINPVYIDLGLAGASLPIEALVVGNEIWVSDQNADKVMRFSLDGTTNLGDIVGGLDNIRGMELVGNEVWVTNAGTNNGAPGTAVVRFSTAGAPLGFHAVNDPFDAVNFQGDVLIANILGEDIDRHDVNGVFLNTFHLSDAVTGIDFPEQLSVRANGNVLAAGFSPPAGIYEYDSTGVQLNYWPTSSARGVIELQNGNILYAAGSNISILDPMTGTSTVLVAAGGRYMTHFAGATPNFIAYCAGDGTVLPCPCANDSAPGANEGCLSSLGLGGKLVGAGIASIAADTVVLTGTQMPNSSALYFQGTTQISTVFGDGLRCAGGSVIRLGTKSNVGGASQYPNIGEPSISLRGLITTPGVRYYQIWYRNAAAFCSPSTFNLSNGLEVTWGA